MRPKFFFPVFLLVASSAAVVHADSAPFGFASAFNIVAPSHSTRASADIKAAQETAAGAANIPFNFPDASPLKIDGAAFAPYAYLSGDSDLAGNIIAAPIGRTGEVHDDPFDGAPASPAPEPATLFLLGTGLLSIAGILNRRSKQ
jgi:PEP-CTERM motif